MRPIRLRLALLAVLCGLIFSTLMPVAAQPTAPPHPLADSPLHVERLEAHWRQLEAGGAQDAEVESFVRTLLYAQRLFAELDLPPSEQTRLTALRKAALRQGSPAPGTTLGAETPVKQFSPNQPPAVSTAAVSTGAVSTPVPLQGADDCRDAPLLEPGSYLGTTAGATRDGAASCAPLGAAGDVWYRVPVGIEDKLFASTEGASFDTVLSVHQTCPPSLGFSIFDGEIACNDNGGSGSTSELGWYPSFQPFEVFVRISGALLDAGEYRLTVSTGGRIEGRVLSESGEPLPGVFVRALSTISTQGFTLSDDQGRFSFRDLRADSYRLVIESTGGYRGELYDDIPCVADGQCPLDSGTRIAVSLGEVVDVGDIHLSLGAAVEGQVTARDSGAAVSDVAVWLQQSDGAGWTAFTDADGRYRLEGLPAGEYRAQVETFGEFQNQLWDGIECPAGCDFADGTPLPLQLGETRLGIDFELARFGQVSGRVATTADVGLSAQSVRLFQLDGQSADGTFSSFDGRFALASVPPGRYYAVAGDGPYTGFVPELFREVPCTETPSGGCDFALGTPIEVGLDSGPDDIDFTLSRGGSVSGRITDAATGEDIAGAYLTFTPVDGGLPLEIYSEADGSYRLFGFAGGDYVLRAQTFDGRYLDVLYPDVICGVDCPFDQAMPVTATFEEETSGIDLALPRSGAVQGRVTAAMDGQPLPGVEIFGSNGRQFLNGFTDADGRYRLDGIEPGSFTLEVTSNEFLFASRTVEVGVSEVVSGVDFALDRGARIIGRVSDRIGNGRSVSVEAVDEELQAVAAVFSDSLTGDYELRGLPAGRYYVVAKGVFGEYESQLWPGVNCPGGAVGQCPGGQLITVGLEETVDGVDFQLDRFGEILGSLRSAVTTGSLDGQVEMYDAAGRFISSTSTFEGVFAFRSLPPGEYHFIARPDDFPFGYMDRIAGGGSCVGNACDPLAGAPLQVEYDTTSTPAFGSLERGGSLSGRFLDANGRLLDNLDVAVDVYDAGGRRLDAAGVSAGRWFLRALPDGDYRLVARDLSGSSFLDQVWPDVVCSETACDPSSGTPVTVSEAQDVGDVDFTIESVLSCGSATELCTLGDRFRTQVRWQTDDAQGEGGAVPLTDESGYFWFFDPDNVEVVIKTLDACDGFGHFWVFTAGLTNVEVEITVFDSFTGATKVYRHEAGDLFAPIFDTTAFATCADGARAGGEPVPKSPLASPPPPAAQQSDQAGEPPAKAGNPARPPAKSCVPSEQAVCLNDGRFRVEAAFSTTGTGSGQARSVQLTSDTAYFWFFDPDNVEVVLKVLDACDGFDRFWVFAAGLTNVEVRIEVTDTETGAAWSYDNPLGRNFQPVADTSSLLCP